MNRVICQLAFRECAFLVIPMMIFLFAYTLFLPVPLKYFDSVIMLLCAAIGFSMGKFIFSDNGGVRPFLFSRTYSPKRFFLVRWLFGIGIITLITVVIALILILGIRQGIQVSLNDSAWYPAVRFYELHVLWTVIIASLLSYHTTLFWVLRNRYLGKRKFSRSRRWGTRLANLFFILVLLVVLGFGVTMIGLDFLMRPGYMLSFQPGSLLILLPPTILQTALAPWYGITCYRFQEIES